MPGCAAVGCFNSSQKGFKMKRFPKDPERRKAWAANLHRKNWQPTDYSVLCETHFHPDMWEKKDIHILYM
ncbi:THAP domain [Popillia japonica]|uniref:THAP domain n=1 Tax=Popillia japonica TaxID=7064 RepID=A0AAW1JXK4_POPJA